jgi:hypothetical protein
VRILVGRHDRRASKRGRARRRRRLIIDGANIATIYGTLNVIRCPCYVELRQFTLQDTGDIAAPNDNVGSIFITSSAWVYCYSLGVQSNGARTANVRYTNGAHGKVEACQLNGATGRCIDADAGAVLWASNNLGGGASNAHRANGAILITNGTQPTGGNGTSGTGIIFTTGQGGTPPAGTGGTAPPTSTKKTVTVNADSTRGGPSGVGAPTTTYQGEWAGSGGLSRGVAFSVLSSCAPASRPTAAKFTSSASRLAASQCRICTYARFAQGTRPGGSPTIVDGPKNVGGLAWGGAKWFDLPVAWVNHLLDGTAKSIGIYHASASPYVICDGRAEGSTRWQVRMTYH